MKKAIPVLMLVFLISSCSPQESRNSKNSGAEVSSGEAKSRMIPSGEEESVQNNHQAVAEAEEEDCIFNNDIKGLTTEAIIDFDASLKFWWDSGQQMAILPLGPDTLKLSVGGCDHFAYTATYTTSARPPQDSLFWFGKINHIARSFWGPTGKNYSQKLETSRLIKTKTNEVIYYEFPPDTAMGNLFYSDIELKKLPNSVQLTIGAYYN